MPSATPSLRVEKLYAYPVKALQGIELTTAQATKYGFSFDRRFLLVKIIPGGHKNISVSNFPESVLFATAVKEAVSDSSVDELTITYRHPGKEPTSLTLPLTPVIDGLETVGVTMHKTSTVGFDMGHECNDWFSECYGFPVKMLYLAENRRGVAFAKRATQVDPVPTKTGWRSWFGGNAPKPDKDEITFADCAPYLVVNKTSLHDVSARLPEGLEMDMIKFRPNIVVQGAAEAWKEDFWAEISVGDIKLDLAHNCGRCTSINIDYETGKPAEGEDGKVLAKLATDRRVDPGNKWSPVFGRYAFLAQRTEGGVMRVGDEVNILRKNEERTVWDWPR